MITKEQTAKIYDTLSGPLYRYILRIVPDASAAEDILHDVFIRFIEKSDRYSFDGDNSAPLLYTIARNRSLDYIKDRSREYVDSDYVAALPQTESESDPELVAEVERCVHNVLDAKHREAFNLRRDNELTYPELAAVSGIPERTLKRRVAEAVDMLASCLKKNGFLILCCLLWHYPAIIPLYIWKV